MWLAFLPPNEDLGFLHGSFFSSFPVFHCMHAHCLSIPSLSSYFQFSHYSTVSNLSLYLYICSCLCNLNSYPQIWWLSEHVYLNLISNAKFPFQMLNQSVFPPTVNEYTSFPISLSVMDRINPRFYFVIVMSKNKKLILICISVTKITSELKPFFVCKPFFQFL